jgi:hypothetical protein
MLHRVISNAPDGLKSDHISGNKLDNRKCNLRLANNHQNSANVGIYRNNTSGRKGVSWITKTSKWNARIVVNKKRIHLGDFDDLEEAANAYEQAAEKYFGEFKRKQELYNSSTTKEVE